MEFQSQNGLVTDGDIGPKTSAILAEKIGNSSLPTGRCILVDLINERLRAFENGLMKLDFHPIKGGAPSDPVDTGSVQGLQAPATPHE